MTKKEFSELKKGDSVFYSIGRNYVQYAEFIAPKKVTSFGKMTFSDLMNNKVDFSKGKEQVEAWVKYFDDNGNQREAYVPIRRLHKSEFSRT